MQRRKREVRSRVARLLALLLLLNGVWILIESLLVRLPDKFDRFLIAGSDSMNKQVSVVAGLGLIYFSLKLRQGKRNAWYMTIISLVIFLQYALLHPDRHVVGIASSMTCLVGLLLAEREFKVKSDPVSLRQSLASAAVILFVVLAYGTAGFAALDKRDFRQEFSAKQSVVRTIRQYSLVGNTDLHARTKQARFFLDSLDLLGMASILFVTATIFRPVRFALGQLPYEYRQAEEILRRYSRSPEDYFKLWPSQRKHFYFSKDRQAFLSFGVFRGVAVVLDDPVGLPSEIPDLLGDFVTYARTNGWAVGFGHCSNEWESVLADYDLEMLPIGQEALIDVGKFVEETSRDKHFRYTRNKFTKLGLRTEYLAAPLSPSVVAELQLISDDWLTRNGRKERTFAMGFFDVDYLSACDVCVVYSHSGEMVAFTNLIPVYQPELASVDLMRYNAAAPPGVMNFLFLGLLEELQKRNVQQFNLGFAPLSGIEQATLDNLPTAALRLIKQLGGVFFSFEGLEQFKGKFKPQWEKRYIAYEGGSAGLLRTTLALLKAMRIEE